MSRENQLAVVTGASSGIGQATVRALAARGFHVLAGVRREADADQLAGDEDRAGHPRHHRPGPRDGDRGARAR